MPEFLLRLTCSNGFVRSELITPDGAEIASEDREMPGPALREGNVQRRLRAGEPISPPDLEDYGRFLGSLAFPASVASAIAQSTQLGSVRLTFEVGVNILDIPWELSYDGDGGLGFLALHPLIRVSRVSKAEKLSPHAGPLCALLASADPQSPTYPALPGGAREYESVQRALRAPECKIECIGVPHATPRSLQEALAGSRCPIFHFIGHGDLTPTGGILILEGGQPHSHEPIFAEELADMLLEAGTKLAVLSGCLTGGSSGSIASLLAEKGIAAVVAMQMPIADTDAHLFARAFYAALTDGFALEEAVFEGRMAIRAAGQSWAAPILISSSPGSALFERVAAPKRQARGNLPRPLTSYIGRTALVAEQTERIQRERLVILFGSGGIGKTRLSIEIARAAEPRFEHGAWQVMLEEVDDPERVVEAIARVFGIRDSTLQPLEERLLDFLRDQQLMLLLDNCEHLVDACRESALRILNACPTVHILATSRQPLGTGAESVVPVPPLSYPDYTAEEPPELAPMRAGERFEAIELFLRRARSANSAFSATSENIHAVGRICARLDGIPLAIELAASRVRTYTPAQILTKLMHDLSWLDQENPGAVPRHRTLRATLDWSYRLLSGNEQILFRRLGLFRGSFSLDSVQQTAALDPLTSASVPTLLANLVDKSLVVPLEGPFEMRYRLLDTCRAYAAELLNQTQERAQLADRHLEFTGRYVQDTWSLALEGRQPEWAAKMRAEHDGIHAAIEWALQSGRPADAARIAVTAFPFWAMMGVLGVGSLANRIIAALPPEEEPLWIRLTLYAGAASFFAGERESYARMKKALEAARLRHPDLARFAVQTLGPCAYEMEDDDFALDLFHSHIEECRKNGTPQAEGFVRLMIANIEIDRQEYERAKSNLESMLAQKEEGHDVRGMGTARCALGYVAALTQDGNGKALFAEGLKELAELEDYATLPDYLLLSACLFPEPEEAKLAATVIGLSDRLREDSGEHEGRVQRTWGRELRHKVQASLGSDYPKWYKNGRTMTVEHILEFFSHDS